MFDEAFNISIVFDEGSQVAQKTVNMLLSLMMREGSLYKPLVRALTGNLFRILLWLMMMFNFEHFYTHKQGFSLFLKCDSSK